MRKSTRQSCVIHCVYNGPREDDFKAIPVDLINRLMGERYQCAGWNEKF